LKILDNGAAEGYSTPAYELHSLADRIDATEIVVPDTLGNADKTIHQAMDFADFRDPNYDYMGVIQGRSAEEVSWCITQWLSMKWVEVIAVPRILVHNLYMTARVDIIETLCDKFSNRFRAIHALGSSSWIPEVIAIRAAGARSMDTSMPAVIGIQERFLSDGQYFSRAADFFTWNATDAQEKCILDNCRTFINWAQAPPGALRNLPASG
jgi:hypothetical protein